MDGGTVGIAPSASSSSGPPGLGGPPGDGGGGDDDKKRGWKGTLTKLIYVSAGEQAIGNIGDIGNLGNRQYIGTEILIHFRLFCPGKSYVGQPPGFDESIWIEDDEEPEVPLSDYDWDEAFSREKTDTWPPALRREICKTVWVIGIYRYVYKYIYTSS